MGRRPGAKKITVEQVKRMMELRRKGKSMTAIAKMVGVHRQTVRFYLKQNEEELFGEEVRKGVLTEGLWQHFRQLSDFATKGLREKLKPSVSEKGQAPILGVPADDLLGAVVEEWERMYGWSVKEKHLLQALREHIPDSDLWVYWDQWREVVAGYEGASGGLRKWLYGRAESCPGIEPQDLPWAQKWLFGSVLTETSGGSALVEIGTEIFGFEDPKVTLSQFAEIKDGDSVGACLTITLFFDAKNRPEWGALKEATKKLKGKEKQAELENIRKEIDLALEILELKHAFPGRCHLCPI